MVEPVAGARDVKGKMVYELSSLERGFTIVVVADTASLRHDGVRPWFLGTSHPYTDPARTAVLRGPRGTGGGGEG